MTGTEAKWVTQFLGEELTVEENRLETAACEIIPCGLEKTVSYGSGTAAGPAAIISASHQLERLIGEDEACRHGLYTHPALDCSAPIAEVLHNLQKQVFACVRRGHIPVTLGGEHSLTYGVVKGLQGSLEQRFGIVQIDAHADLRTAYQGETHSHASVMQLCCSADIPLFQLGVRALCREEVEARKQYNVGYCDADRLVRQQLSTVTMPDDFPELVYVSFDLDGLDPSVLPATGTPVPGGLEFYQALDLISSACSGRKIVGFDIVELAPSAAHPASDFAAALVTYHLIALALAQR